MSVLEPAGLTSLPFEVTVTASSMEGTAGEGED